MYIILFRYKARMSKCSKCFARYCNDECARGHWQEHKPLCKELVAYLARKMVDPADQSAKARRYSERLRAQLAAPGIGIGFQFLDEATYWQRRATLGIE